VRDRCKACRRAWGRASVAIEEASGHLLAVGRRAKPKCFTSPVGRVGGYWLLRRVDEAHMIVEAFVQCSEGD